MTYGQLRIGASVLLLVAGFAVARPSPTVRTRALESWRSQIDYANHRCRVTTILVRNISVVAALWFGLVSGGLVTVATLLASGWLIGVQVGDARAAGLPGPAIVAALLPHGVLEVPALVLAGSYGLRGSALLMDLARHGSSEEMSRFAPFARHVARVTALLLCAALVECYVTAHAIRSVLE